LEAALAITYLVGVLGAIIVGRSRAGLSQGRLSPATVLGSLPWFMTQIFTLLFWPVTLIAWLVRGRPASPWQAVDARDGSVRVRRVPAGERAARD